MAARWIWATTARTRYAWFSNNVEIPGNITLPNEMRSVQPNVTGQPEDVYATSPWRAPGSAPVFGSGCGVAGGSNEFYLNGGGITGYKQGMDGLQLPKHGKPEVWKRGETAEIAWAIAANHGGGYSYRICPSDGVVNEECFQAHPLDFAGETADILYPNGTRITFPLSITRTGTSPPGSQWARDPIPGCYTCDAYQTCGAPLAPVSGTGDNCHAMTTEPTCEATIGEFGNNCTWYSTYGCYDKPPPDTTCAPLTTEAACKATTGRSGNTCQWYAGGKGQNKCYDTAPKSKSPAKIWDAQVDCYGECDGAASSKASGQCPEGTTVYPSPTADDAFSGFGKGGWEWSIADQVKVPSDLKPGPYLLSWRWDCEESTQVWQNCADLIVE